MELWLIAAGVAPVRFEDLFTSEWSDGRAILLNLALLGLLVIFVRIDWSHVVAGLATDRGKHAVQLSRRTGHRPRMERT
jgi:hypothetical protein